MSRATVVPGMTTPPLPALPNMADVQQRIAVRLCAIETEVLPVLARRRALLERTWGVEAGSGVPVYIAPGHTISCDPVGADRLSATAAEQHALELEAAALGELLSALDLYESGGSATHQELGGEGPLRTEATTGRCPPTIEDRNDGLQPRDPAYVLWLLQYILHVHRELWNCRRNHDREGISALEAELRALLERLRCCTPDGSTVESAVHEPRRLSA